MSLALAYARQAQDLAEVPIGCVAVYQDQVVGYGFNLRETSQDATTHAEIQAIRMANQSLASWRLADVDLYVTLEPCPMCSGAMILSRVRHVYYGASDPKGGTAGSLMNLLADNPFNHNVGVTSGILAEECGQILQDFFRSLRARKKAEREKA
ncbi:deaminase [Aerococcus urinaehominis]|uniref:tRNA-specific adenosine deaminase n=2 Tax=Aerococcus urinaehominis TaxID=128944 RepID=A0A0X8FMG2_9LACT|nr:tRNA adenosine(34) deaminase TadA [Aerococcus urinaehominis]AMC00038.1 deaminase [Aerococcus urinaehominis]